MVAPDAILLDHAAQCFARPHFNISGDALGRKALYDVFPSHRRRHLPDQRVDRRRRGALRLGIDVGDDRHARIGASAPRAARAPGALRPASSARSGTARSPVSGIARLAPSAFARSLARATAAAVPAITIWPGAIEVRGAHHLALRRLLARLLHAGLIEAEDRRHRARADRHGLLHVAAAIAHQPHGIGERQRAGRDVRRVLAEAVAGDERRRQAALARAGATPRRSSSGSRAACSRSASGDPSGR